MAASHAAEHTGDGVRSHDVMKNRVPDPRITVEQIIIIGNETIPLSRILEFVPVYPGGSLRMSDLRAAECNMARLDLFVIDWKKGVRPRIAINGTKERDVVVDIIVSV